MRFILKIGDFSCDEMVNRKNKLIINAFDSTVVQYILRKSHMKYCNENINAKKINELNQFLKLKIKKWQKQVKNKEEFK